MIFQLFINADPIAAVIAIAILCLTFLLFFRMRQPHTRSSDTAVPPMLKEPADDRRTKAKQTVRLERED